MAKRRRRTPRKKTSRWLILAQVLTLVGVLVFILLFRDLIANGAGEAFGSFGPPDVQVKKADESSEGQPSKPSAPSTDAQPD